MKIDIYVESQKLWDSLCIRYFENKKDSQEHYNLFIRLVKWYYNNYKIIPSIKDIVVLLDLSDNKEKII